MQPLNHDMDDLMRRAAEDYPVKPQGMDWEKVAQQLGATDADTAANQHGGLKKLLLLLPFILASFVCDRFLAYEYGHLKKLDVTKQIHAQGNQSNVATVSKNKQQTSDLPTTKTAVLVYQKQASNTLVLKNNRPSETMPLKKTNRAENETSFPFAYEPVNLSLTSALDRPTGVNALTFPLTKKPIVITRNSITEKNKTTRKTERDKGYISLLIGPDYSRVKGQEVKPAGYNVGIMAGYWFAKQWAIETGVLWDRKNYFSKGDFFKTNKVQLPEHTKLLQVDGYCAMFEIPVNLRYKMVQGRHDAVTVSAGGSSYLMHKEDYNYVSQRYGVNYTGNVGYQHASKNWFSVMNLSLGYEHQLGQKFKIHIEPYLKIPVKGVGIGSLPLSSKGVLVGVTYPIQ